MVLCCCWEELPLPFMTACKIGVEDCSRLRLVLEDCGEVEPTEEDDDAELLADDDATELFVELLLVDETVTTF